MTHYSCGFLFNDEKTKVVLIEKNRPVWQKGFLNGVGGHIEAGETALAAMVREFYEETGVKTKREDWDCVCKLSFPKATVTFFLCANSDYIAKIRSTTDELLYKIDVDKIDCYSVVENIPALITLSLQRMSIELPNE